MDGYDHLQQMYAGEDYYWGRQPNGFARKALEFLCLDRRRSKLRVVDLGAGEVRDAVLFTLSGLDTLAVDVAPNGLRKAVWLAGKNGVGIRVERGYINTFELVGEWELIYSIGTIQYLKPEKRRERFQHLQQQTSPSGINALFAFVDHPDVPPTRSGLGCR